MRNAYRMLENLKWRDH